MLRRYFLSFASSLLSLALICASGSFAQNEDSTSPTSAQTNENTSFKPLKISTEAEDINITFDATLAREQIKKYPDNPEAHFVLAVALTRSSRVEEAFKEIRISRRLAPCSLSRNRRRIYGFSAAAPHSIPLPRVARVERGHRAHRSFRGHQAKSQKDAYAGQGPGETSHRYRATQ